MDWARAIERNRDALVAILAGLFAMLGLTGTVLAGRIPRQVHRAVLRVLRPAESALRRLIVIAARGLVAKPVAARPMVKGSIIKRGANRPPAFPLFDPRKRFAPARRRSGRRVMPRIVNLWPDPHLSPLWQRPQVLVPVKPPDDGCVDARRLGRRLEALKLALADLPRQARRLARAQARRANVPRLKFQAPMRPGRAPGYRRKPEHDVDRVLQECHELAWEVVGFDTS